MITIVCTICILYLAGANMIQTVSAQELASFNFKQIISDNEGHKYIIGEIQNNDPDSNIYSVIYFSKTDQKSAYYSQSVGVMGHNMAMPFKIDLNSVPYDLDINDMKISAQVTLQQPANFLQVDYSSLHMDHKTHAISGMLQNNSTLDVSDIRVYAIAMDGHAKVLDVTESKTIDKILANGTASFTLVPLDSISQNVSYYSCYVPGGPGATNYTLPTENGQQIEFGLQTDGKIKHVTYNASDHSINFDATAVFPMGGWVSLMMYSEPDSYAKSDSLVGTVNGEKPYRMVASSEITDGKTYKHLSIVFPLGHNTVSIKPAIQTPEFPFALPVLLISVITLIVFFRIRSKFQF